MGGMKLIDTELLSVFYLVGLLSDEFLMFFGSCGY
jgi:hypothetical protein